MDSVFVSYALADADIARALLAALELSGVSLHAHEAPHDLPQAGAQAIAGADHVLVLWSAAAAASAWVSREIDLAIKAWSTDRLILARADSTPLPAGLRDLPTIDLATNRERGISEAVRQIDARQRAQPPSPPGAPPVASRRPRRRTAYAMLLALAGLILSAALVGGIVYQRSRLTQQAAEQAAIERSQQDRAYQYDTTPGRPGPSILVPLANPAPTPKISDGMAVAWALGLAAILVIAAIVVWRKHSTTHDSKPVPASHPAGPVSDLGEHQIFVSYSRRDATAVDRIVREIEGSGHRVWIDRQAGGHTGMRYAAPIVAAIKSSRVIALMCSHHAFASDHVVREIYVAGDFKKPFVAFLLDAAEVPDELLYFLSGFPRIPANQIEPALIRSTLAGVAP